MVARWPPPSLSETPWRAVLPDLESLLERLIQHQVEFLVIGGSRPWYWPDRNTLIGQARLRRM
jgi:hypothetical protein